MPILSGFDTIRILAHTKTPTKVIVVSTYDDRGIALEMLKAGACAYFAKDHLCDKLVPSLLRVVTCQQDCTRCPQVCSELTCPCYHYDPSSPHRTCVKLIQPDN